MARKFFYVCAGLFLLVGTFALGARSVEAQQSASDFSGITVEYIMQTTTAITASGDVYSRAAIPVADNLGAQWNDESKVWTYLGNVLDGIPVTGSSETLGGVKSQYR